MPNISFQSYHQETEQHKTHSVKNLLLLKIYLKSILMTASESKIGFENRDPGFELKTETGFQN